MNPAGANRSPRRIYTKSGLYRLKAAVSELGSRAVDRRTTVGRALAAWRRDLIADLGGTQDLSTQRQALVDLVVREKLLLDSIDAYLLELGGGIINRRRRALAPVVRERSQLADSLTRRLQALGLDRRVTEAPDLGRYLAQRYGAPEDSGAAQQDRERDGVDREPAPKASPPVGEETT